MACPAARRPLVDSARTACATRPAAARFVGRPAGARCSEGRFRLDRHRRPIAPAQPDAVGDAVRAAHALAALCRLDRKSVVEGKSVSVRVDLGGSRIIKKKKNTNKTTLKK